MDLDAAMNELGLAPDASDEEVRKAYLRLLKTRKPESDPDGFMRLREAYDIARESGAYRRMAREASNGDRYEDDAEPESESSPAAPIAAPQPVELNARRRAAPKPPRERHASADTEPATRVPVPLVQHVRAQIYAPQVFQEPWPLPGRSLDAWVQRIGDTEAADRIASALDRATTNGATLPFAPGLAIDAALMFVAAGKRALAKRVLDGFNAWLKETGAELRVVRGAGGVVWNMARELVAIAPEISPEVLATLARAVRMGTPATAVEPLQQHARDHRDAIDTAASVIARSAATLHGVFGAMFDSVRGIKPPARQASGRSGWWGAWFVVMALSGVLRNMTSSDHDHNSIPPPSYSDNAPYELAEPPRPRNAALVAPSRNYNAAISAIITDTQSRGADDVVRTAMQLEDAIGRSQCAQMRDHRAALERELNAFDTTTAWRRAGDLSVIDAEIQRRCASEASVPATDGSSP